MDLIDVLVGVAVLVGLIGIVVPVLPGSLLIFAAVLVWTIDDGSPSAWLVFSLVVTFLVAGGIVKYAVPGRRLNAAGVPRRTLLTGALLGVAGFFVIPVLGLFVGFVAGVYLAESQRLGREQAWPSTKQALAAVGLSVLIELLAGTLAAISWLVGVVVL